MKPMEWCIQEWIKSIKYGAFSMRVVFVWHLFITVTQYNGLVNLVVIVPATKLEVEVEICGFNAVTVGFYCGSSSVRRSVSLEGDRQASHPLRSSLPRTGPEDRRLTWWFSKPKLKLWVDHPCIDICCRSFLY